jgi:hypothetical protein
MKRAVLTILLPPAAACRYGCAGCCAAPITVFWIASLVSLVYGLIGGPTRLMGPNGYLVLLGLALWGIAAVWTAVTIRGADEDKCQGKSSTLCTRIMPAGDESDPFDEVRKAR